MTFGGLSMVKKKILFALIPLSVGCMTVLLLVYEPYTSEAIVDTLALFIRRVLPPLFPYMVISKLMVSMDLLAPLRRFFRIGQIFRLPSETASVVFTGLLCGFPVGAIGTASLYEERRISKMDAARLVALSSNTSPAFVLGTVAALWGSKVYGGFLFAVQTLSAIGIAWLIAKRTKYKETPQEKEKGVSGKVPVAWTEAFCKAVSESAAACLSVCAYIVFFRVIAVVCSLLLPSMTKIFAVIFEFSSGCVDGAAVGGIMGIFMTGSAVGSAGLSVMMQNYNFIGRYGIPTRFLWLTKGLQGVICGGASVLFYMVCPLESCKTSTVSGDAFSWNTGILMLSSLFLLSKLYKISKRVI